MTNLENRLAFGLIGLIGVMLAGTVPAVSQAANRPEGECPPHWYLVKAYYLYYYGLYDQAREIDERGNDDGYVCLKKLPGQGNTGTGLNIKDNNQP